MALSSVSYLSIKKPLSFSNDKGFSFYFKLIFEISYFSNQLDEAVLASCWQSFNFYNLYNLDSYNFCFDRIISHHCNLGNFFFSKLSY